MGLDTVELVFEIEEAFGVSIPDDEAPKILTVGDLHQFVVKCYRERRGAPTEQLLVPLVFHRIQRAAANILHVPPESIAPNDEIQAIVPAASRRTVWKQLAVQTAWKLPDLQYSIASTVTMLAVAILIGIMATSLRHGIGAILAAAGTGLLVFVVGFIGLVRWQRNVERNSRTWQSLALTVLSLNYAQISTEYHSWSDEEIWLGVQRIVSYQLGVALDQVTPTARIVGDLGAD